MVSLSIGKGAVRILAKSRGYVFIISPVVDLVCGKFDCFKNETRYYNLMIIKLILNSIHDIRF